MSRLRLIFYRHFALAAAFMLFSLHAVLAQQTDNQTQDKHIDVRSSSGDLHVGNDADAHDTGMPLYPGARVRHDADDKHTANFAIATAAFGLKLVVVNFDSDDAPAKIVAYYRDKMKKYGKVIECHTSESGGDVHVNDSDKDNDDESKELKCEGDNTGNVVELKVGTADHQHLVSVAPAEKGSGSTFALVFVHMRGKQGDI
jgi:hypothetical protein